MGSGLRLAGTFLVAFALLIISPFPLFADITGTFGTDIHLFPPEVIESEFEQIDFDIENELNLTVVISGLSTTFHTHFGIAGVEDVIITSHATLGALDVDSLILFGRFPCDCLLFPAFDDLQFFGLQVTSILNLGGVQLTHIAIDQNGEGLFSGSTVADDVFGNVFRVAGVTPSGIEITGEAGFCVYPFDVDIKKHDDIFEYSANFFCSVLFTGEEKPDILFDFEDVLIEGIPLAPGISMDAEIFCDFIQIIFGGGCLFDTIVEISGGPVPFSAEIELVKFSDPLDPFSLLFFNGAEIALQSGVGTLYLHIDETGVLDEINLVVDWILNPESHPAAILLDILVIPGVGVVDVDIVLEIVRAGLELDLIVDFDPGPAGTALFDEFTFDLATSTGILDILAGANFDLDELNGAFVQLVLNF